MNIVEGTEKLPQMKVKIFGYEISKTTKELSVTDLVRHHKDFNLSLWLTKKSTLKLIKEIEEKYNIKSAVIKFRGRNAHTWVHPILFFEIASSISPKLKIKIYEMIGVNDICK